MMKRTSRVAAAALALAVLSGGGTTALAGTSFEFLWSAQHVSDDGQLFLNLAVSDSGFARAEIEAALPRIGSVNNHLPVVLFAAERSGRSIDFVVGLRSRGLSWAVVFERCGLRPDVLFVGIDRDPGPPYGKAWGYWKKNPKARLADADIAGLVAVQFGARHARLTPFDMARARGQGKKVATLVADKHGRPYKAAKPGGPGAKPKDKGKPGDHGKPGGHGKPNNH